MMILGNKKITTIIVQIIMIMKINVIKIITRMILKILFTSKRYKIYLAKSAYNQADNNSMKLCDDHE